MDRRSRWLRCCPYCFHRLLPACISNGLCDKIKSKDIVLFVFSYFILFPIIIDSQKMTDASEYNAKCVRAKLDTTWSVLRTSRLAPEDWSPICNRRRAESFVHPRRSRKRKIQNTEVQRTRRRFEVSRKQDAALQRQHYSQLWPTWAEKSYYLVLENVGICSIMNQVIRKKMLVHILQRASIARLCRSSSLDSV